EEIRLEKASVRDDFFDLLQAVAGYTRAFREYGIDVAMLDPMEGANRIKERPISVELAAALDDWAMLQRGSGKADDKAWRHLLAVARMADDDGWRNLVRDAWERNDVKAAEQLARSDQAAALPAPTAILLATWLKDTGRVEGAIDLLRKVQRRHPDDFWINHDIAKHLPQVRRAHDAEAT